MIRCLQAKRLVTDTHSKGLEERILYPNKRSGSASSKGKVDQLVLAPKWCLALWRADPSFMNLVTGSGNVANAQISYMISICL
jgi:hypothetical protein